MSLTYSAAGRASNTLRLAPFRGVFSSRKQQRDPYHGFLTFSAAPFIQTVPLQSISASASQSPSAFKKPEVIEWRDDMISNKATFIGYIMREVRIKYLDSGNIVANSSLKVKRLLREASWFYLEFWDDLAEIAAAHLKVDDLVFVAGSVWSERVQDKDGVSNALAKVVVEDLKFVNKLSPSKSISRVQNLSYEGLWEYLFENPTEWLDCRENKPNDRMPDFKHTLSTKSLWLENEHTPNWVKERLEKVSGSFNTYRGTEERWKSFFADPSQWWDNRTEKVFLERPPRYPDFRHRLTYECLWIESDSTPKWVKAKLAELDLKRGGTAKHFLGS